jgi:hypothetical protein
MPLDGRPAVPLVRQGKLVEDDDGFAADRVRFHVVVGLDDVADLVRLPDRH